MAEAVALGSTASFVGADFSTPGSSSSLPDPEPSRVAARTGASVAGEDTSTSSSSSGLRSSEPERGAPRPAASVAGKASVPGSSSSPPGSTPESVAAKGAASVAGEDALTPKSSASLPGSVPVRSTSPRISSVQARSTARPASSSLQLLEASSVLLRSPKLFQGARATQDASKDGTCIALRSKSSTTTSAPRPTEGNAVTSGASRSVAGALPSVSLSMASRRRSSRLLPTEEAAKGTRNWFAHSAANVLGKRSVGKASLLSTA
mmetsp:Transcript_72344/g.157083  ORF Transcript_72344/g.157083 Transcript_72344/m.157083 type:complete len:263 (+) Transcript_72344:282-1070(+)